MKELKSKDLKISIRLPKNIKTSECIQELSVFIGQDEAIKSLERGLEINTKGYNIFVSGLTDTGRRTFVKRFLAEKSLLKNVPEDWVYVNNFENYRNPNVIKLKAGLGKLLKKKLKESREIIVKSIIAVFQSEDYQKRISELQKKKNEEKSKYLKEMIDKARKLDYDVKITQAGVSSSPIYKGKTLTKEVYETLPEDIKKELDKKGEKVVDLINKYILKLSSIDRDSIQMINDLNRDVAKFSIRGHIKELKEYFSDNKEIQNYLERMNEDILDNLNVFFSNEISPDKNFSQKYSVNLFVDNSSLKGCPVIEELNVNYSNLFGRIEYESKMGTLETDYRMIRAGAFHRANGGYLILDARTVLSEPYVWEKLKQVLSSSLQTIENLQYRIGLVSTVSLKPEPVPLNTKVIIIGEPWIYNRLSLLDPDFHKLFKIKAEFDWEMDFNPENAMNICRFICSTVKENKLLHFDREALKETIKKAIFMAGNRRKISTKFGKLKQLIIESSAEANESSPLVKAIHVKKAWNGIKMRASLYKEKMENAIYNNTIYIDTEGEKIGEINGLTVLENEDIAFGNPVKIIAKVSSGSKGFIDIQKETGLGGKIHHKASMTIQGYLNSNFGRDFPIDVNAFISFEQVYGKIEGDSASVAELVALLSSISEIPLKQSIAVTGSINQSGLVQPVGGIPFKIEGFYNICKKRGLDGSHGVIIPFSNINNLVLPDEIINDISKSRFHIWTIENVDEAIEILTGKKAGKRINSGKFEKNSFNERVKSKLENFYNILKKDDKEKH